MKRRLNIEVFTVYFYTSSAHNLHPDEILPKIKELQFNIKLIIFDIDLNYRFNI